MSQKPEIVVDYLSANLSGALVTWLIEENQYQFHVCIPSELITHLITFERDELDQYSPYELFLMFQENDLIENIEVAPIAYEITFKMGVMRLTSRNASLASQRDIGRDRP